MHGFARVVGGDMDTWYYGGQYTVVYRIYGESMKLFLARLTLTAAYLANKASGERRPESGVHATCLFF